MGEPGGDQEDAGMNDQVHGRTLGRVLTPVNRQCRSADTAATPFPGTPRPRPPPPDQAADPPDFESDQAGGEMQQPYLITGTASQKRSTLA